MSFSRLLSKTPTSAIKSLISEDISRRLFTSCCSIYPIHGSFVQKQVPSINNPVKFNSLLKASSLSGLNSGLAKEFTTSSTLLAQHKAHDHSKLWTFERILSAVLLPLVPVALLSPSQAADTALAIVLVLHTHFGLEAVVVDYIRPILFGELAPKLGLGLLYLFSIVTLAGLLNLIYNDAGLANTIIAIWKK